MSSINIIARMQHYKLADILQQISFCKAQENVNTWTAAINKQVSELSKDHSNTIKTLWYVQKLQTNNRLWSRQSTRQQTTRHAVLFWSHIWTQNCQQNVHSVYTATPHYVRSVSKIINSIQVALANGGQDTESGLLRALQCQSLVWHCPRPFVHDSFVSFF